MKRIWKQTNVLWKSIRAYIYETLFSFRHEAETVNLDYVS